MRELRKRVETKLNIGWSLICSLFEIYTATTMDSTQTISVSVFIVIVVDSNFARALSEKIHCWIRIHRSAD